MRILYFYQYFTTPKGAWSTRAYEFSRRWVATGDQVTVVTSVYDKSDLKPEGFVDALEVDGIDVRVVNIGLSNKHGFLRRLATFAAYALTSSWYALTLQADVVLASSGPITVWVPGLIAHWLRGRPLVFEARDLWPEGAIQLGILRSRFAIALARWFERLCYRTANVNVALSPGIASHARELVPTANVVVVPNAADNDLFWPPRKHPELPQPLEGKMLVVYTGTLGTIDDCGQILDAAAVLQARARDDIHIVLVGDGSEGVLLRERASVLGLENVSFTGLLGKEKVAEWLSSADISLLTTKDVPFLDTASPNKLFDALAAGVPVIQTTQGWIRDLLQSERCGVSVRPGDAEGLANAIVGLVDVDDARSEMGAQARRVAIEQFDRDLLASRLRQALVQAAGLPE